jgi:hypothetical protein
VKIYTNDLDFGNSKDARMFVNVWKEVQLEFLREFKYMADCADLGYDVTILYDSVISEWSGFNDSLSNFILETIKRIKTMANSDLRDIFD